MQLIRGHYNLRPEHHGCVATIGNFDGVHLGHLSVLRHLADKAAETGLPSTVITFEPTPLEFFAGEKAPARLTRFREKYIELRCHGLERMFCLQFNQGLAQMEAKQFIDDILIQGLGLKYLVVGDDFRFGKDRKGDFAMLKQAGEQHGFDVISMDTFSQDEERVSSTLIRQHLMAGNLEQAHRLLGRAYSIRGRVVHGAKLGRTIGFPTANVLLRRKVTPVHGVYAVEVLGLDDRGRSDRDRGDKPVPGVANVGKRPTVGGTRVQLEVHLFDFDQSIYGREVEVRFSKHLRQEQKFESFDALKEQILVDAQAARGHFGI